jgi:hypothetical protein
MYWRHQCSAGRQDGDVRPKHGGARHSNEMLRMLRQATNAREDL